MSALTVRKPNVDLSRGFAPGEQTFVDSVRAAPPEAIRDPLLRALWSWHAAEETEHKAVAAGAQRRCRPRDRQHAGLKMS